MDYNTCLCHVEGLWDVINLLLETVSNAILTFIQEKSELYAMMHLLHNK